MGWDLLEFALMACIFYSMMSLLFEQWFGAKERYWNRILSKIKSEGIEDNG